MHFTKADASAIGRKLKIDWKKIDFNQFHMGLNVELEHGLKYARYGTNITNDDPIKTGKIALIHLIEVPDYYTRLRAYVDKNK